MRFEFSRQEQAEKKCVVTLVVIASGLKVYSSQEVNLAVRSSDNKPANDVVREIAGVRIVKEPMFLSTWKEEEFCGFEINGRRFIVEEPLDGNDRYWISPEPPGLVSRSRIGARSICQTHPNPFSIPSPYVPKAKNGLALVRGHLNTYEDLPRETKMSSPLRKRTKRHLTFLQDFVSATDRSVRHRSQASRSPHCLRAGCPSGSKSVRIVAWFFGHFQDSELDAREAG